ncbi:hypothetical protein ATANTOWER_029506 [Ataeniobius toweri]|uniref:Uncharacterized protein n=1 Tax=Ataeniobius toweri TaxID=208326 RepID=A0ABU7AIA8_9TELE|nr:hypothetical protein [Ataeniobius toweri]
MPHTPLPRISSPSGVPTGKQRFLRRRTHVIKKEMGVEVNKMRVQSGRHNVSGEMEQRQNQFANVCYCVELKEKENSDIKKENAALKERVLKMERCKRSSRNFTG